MRTIPRIGLALGVALFVLAAVTVTVFAIGKPVTPQASLPPAAPAAPAAGQPPSQTATPAARADEEPSGPLAIEIPGCVCHSDDPQVVAEHATYRMSECFDCHQGGMPEMGR